MSTRFEERVQKLFAQACELSSEELRRFLREVSREEPAVHVELVSLLEHLDRAEDERFLEAEPKEFGLLTTEKAPAEEEPRKRAFGPPRRDGELGRLGDYRLLRLLGSGGMGEVYEAEDLRLRRRVALKVMSADLAKQPTSRGRFLREARAAASLRHDNVVTVHQVGEDRGLPYLVMPLLVGETLQDRLKRDGPLPIAEALRIGREISAGLAAAHEAGLIHRDVKPSNIWLERPNGRAKLLDFGLARPVDPEGPSSVLTQPGAVLGTPQYIAPEQVSGAAVDQRCDLFSLGCVLYQMITGVAPFQGRNLFEVLGAIASRIPAAPIVSRPETPRALSDLVQRLLSKDPANRPASAASVAAELQRVERGEAAKPAPEDAPAPGRQRPRRWLAAAVAAGMLLLGSLAYALGPMIVRVATNRGELIVDVNDPNVEISIIHDGVAVVEKTSETRFELTAGDGEIIVRDKKSGLKLATQAFTLTRGGRETVRVTVQNPAPAPAPISAAANSARPVLVPPHRPAAADPPNPFRVLSARGEPRGEFAGLEEALLASRDGEIIEIHGDGPFPLTPKSGFTLENESRTLRAGPGRRPRIENSRPLEKHQPWYWWDALFGAKAARLRVEGCDLALTSHFFHGWTGSTLELDRCRVLGVGALARLVDSTAELRNSMILNNGGGSFPTLLELAGNSDRVELENCVVVCDGVMSISSDTRSVELKVTDNSIVAFGFAKISTTELQSDVVARNNVVSLLRWTGEPSTAPLNWRGGHNLQHPTTLHPPWEPDEAGGSLVKAADPKVFGLADLAANPDALMTPRVEWGWSHVRRVGPEAAKDLLKPWVESIRSRDGAPADAGPDWDSIGPGEPYARARLAAHPNEPNRPAAPSGGPFVLLRKGELVEAFPSLEAAFEAAVDGDEIEIRGDGPYRPALPPANREGLLTIRAAAGYRPILEGDWYSYENPPRLALEGLLLRNAAMMGPFIVDRMAFCATEDSPLWRGNVDQPLSRGGVAAEIDSCLIPTWVQIVMAKDRPAMIKNSVVGPVRVFPPETETGNLDMDGSLVLGLEHSAIRYYGAPRNEGSFAVSSRRCVFETGRRLWMDVSMDFDRVDHRAGWSGADNIYALGLRPMRQPRLTDEAKPSYLAGDPTSGLEALKEFWGSGEEGSIIVDPLIDSPDLWRLLPGSPGSGAGPDGRDMGADPSRIMAASGGD